MKIDTSNVNLSSTHHYTEQNTVQFEQETRFSDLFDNRLRRFEPDQVLHHQSIEISAQWYTVTPFQGQNAVTLSDQFLQELEKLQQILDSIIRELNRSSQGCCCHLSSLDRIHINLFSPPTIRMVEYEYQERRTFTHFEQESTQFNADGVVQTEDGQSMDFSFAMNLEREFFLEDQVVYTEKGYHLIDPLVINLDGSLPQLAETYFSFDLDGDGIEEELPTLAPGTGFLSFDKNHDGIINDGSELFGPTTGSGFEELSQYDLDHNLWIDENDAIFDELTIWESDDQGEMHLTKIKDAGIGAIYLESVETPFDYRDENNELQARVKRSGIALNENGTVAGMQEIDYTV